jgi:hypothetical protein
MNRVLKTLLLWLLVLALPMQTYAAATMFFCGTTFEHTAETVVEAATMDHATVQHGGPEFHAPDSMHHTAHAHDAHHARHASDQAAHASHSAERQHSSCSICAVCCVGIAMMPAAIDWHPPHADAEIPLAALVVSFSGHIPPGIDRPPRTIFA